MAQNVIKAALVSSAMIAAGFATPAHATNLITNGGFETGNFSGWTQSGNLGATYVGSSPNAPYAGSYAAQLGAVGSDDSLAQTLTTTVGQQYDVNFWHIYNAAAGGVGDFEVLWNDTNIFSQPNPVSGSPPIGPLVWTDYNFIVSGTGSDTLTILSRNDPSYQGLDNVSVSAVPLPGSLPMFSAALLGLVGIGVKSRRKLTA